MPKYHGLDSMQRNSSKSFLLLIFWFWAEQDRESSFLCQCNFVSGMDHFEVLDAYIDKISQRGFQTHASQIFTLSLR